MAASGGSGTGPQVPDVVPGTLLVSSPAMSDPNFTDTVVMVLDVDDDSVLGVVLNRPSPLLIAAVLGEWADWAAEPEVLFRGGPVGPDAAVALACLRSTEGVPDGFQPVIGPVGLLDLDTPVDEISGALVQVRLFAGYAGWDADQLRGELARGDWDVVPGEPGDVFCEDTSDLWRSVLRRQPGELAWRSTRPATPELN